MYKEIFARLSAAISAAPGRKKVCFGRCVLGSHQQLQFIAFCFPRNPGTSRGKTRYERSIKLGHYRIRLCEESPIRVESTPD